MKKLLLPLLLLVCWSMNAQINETFESGTATENWRAFFGATNGKYLGIVDNPLKDKTNSSNKCIGYVKGATAYALFGDSLAKPLNLKTNNLFKVQVFARRDAKTSFIFKLEGPKGVKEASAKIPTTRGWRDYTFDFSSIAANDSINRIFMFFDNGVDASTDTFYVDNIQQLPANACAGTVAIPNIIDDFECQRNASYGYFYDSISVVANPDKTGINTSANCGKYSRQFPNSYPFVLNDYYTPIDLSTYNYMRMKVWAPKACDMLMKIEGGPGAAGSKEVHVPITAAQAGKWVEIGADFSDKIFAGATRAVVFFNDGVDGTSVETYYFDDWRFTEQPALEDFEPTAKMTWGPKDGNAAQHGSFVLANNPTPNPVNASTSVGKYTKGAAAFSVLTGVLPAGFKVDSLSPQINLSVLAPAGSVGKTVTVQLVSATLGPIGADALLDSAGAWTELKFDMSKAIGVTDISTINVLFDVATTGVGTMYFFDNLRQSKSTINACLGIAKLPNTLDDFECQRNATYGGTPPLKAVKNPAPSSANQSTTVGQYTDPVADPFAALTIPYTTAIDLSKFNQLSMQVYGGPKGLVPMLFKLEGGTSPAVQIWDTLRSNTAWQTFKIDFSGAAAGNFKQISLFFNAGVTNPNADVYYIDNLQWLSAPITGCAVNFETPVTFTYFADDTLDGKHPRIVANPKKSGINTSANVMEFRRIPAGAVYQGAYTDLPAPAKWTDAKIVLRAKVFMDHIGNVGFKLEGAPLGQNAELQVPNTKVNEWEELTGDFSSKFSGTEGFTRITMFIDETLPVATTTQVSYLDDIVIGSTGSCVSTGIFDPIKVEALSVFPNPASEVLIVRNAQNIRRLDVTNLLGQRVQTTAVSNLYDDYNLSIGTLSKGMYIVSAYDETGKLSAIAKFTKE